MLCAFHLLASFVRVCVCVWVAFLALLYNPEPQSAIVLSSEFHGLGFAVREVKGSTFQLSVFFF